MPKPPFVFRYRVRNWRAYNHALINRGRLTVWFDEHTVTAWRNTEPAAGPGAPRLYADLAIECALVFKSPTAHERAMKLCSSVGPRPPSCRGVRRNRTPPRILSVGGLRAITSSCRSRNRDAPRGGSSFSGCTRQNIAENTMFRFKRLFGGQLWAQNLTTQRTEALVKCAVLNRMTQLGMPQTVRV